MQNRMMSILVLLLIGFICCTGCNKKKETTGNSAEIPAEQSTFVPPADSVITVDQMGKWVVCNPLLDSLSYLYQDSFKIDNPSKRLKYQKDYSAAQDRICVLSGLPGGYPEYTWIFKTMGNPKNKAVMDSFQLSAY